MALDATGMSINRQAEWVKDLQQRYTQKLNFQPVFDVDDPFTHIIDVQSTLLALFDEAKLAIYQSLDLDQAEGVSLDRELRKLGATRNVATRTSGNVRFYGVNNSSIPTDSRLSNPYTEEEFRVINSRTLAQTNCDSVKYLPSAVTNGKVYSVDINSVTYSYTATGSDTLLTISTALANDIISANVTGITAAIDAPTNTFRVYSTTDDINVLATNNSELTIQEVQLDVPVESVETGPINGQQYSVNTLTSAVGGITRVQNLENLGTGRNRETDVEFRTRALATLEQSGSGTANSIRAEVLDVAEVSSCLVLENTTNVTDSDGVEANSIKVVVVAPDTADINQSIAEAIGRKLPAGRRTTGDVVTTLTLGGSPVDVKFSRPAEQPIAVRITATRYTEKDVPVDINSLIKGAVVARGNLFGTGHDVISGQLAAAIYGITDGFDSITAEIQTLSSSGDVPAVGDWSEARISINASTSSTFNVQDVYVV